MKAHELGMDLSKDTPEVREILQQLKQLEHEGYEFEAADASFHILVQKLLERQHKPFFKPLTYYAYRRLASWTWNDNWASGLHRVRLRSQR
jgi:2-isopropylmalate synthase